MKAYISPKNQTQMTTVSFNTSNNAFFLTLKKKVDSYFKDNNIKSTGNIHLYLKTFVLFSLMISTYITLVFFSANIFLNIVLCGFLGFVFAGIGFSVMHDGAHGSYSSKKWINELMSNALHVMGGSAFLWKVKHNINHHSFTNIEGFDDDIDIQPWMRIHPDQPKLWFHKFQHIYWAFLYGLTYISWIYWRDFSKYFSRQIANTKIKNMKTRDHIEFWAWKIIYTAIFVVIPLFKLGIIPTLVGYSIMCYVCGFVISIVFQLAHIVEPAAFPVPDETNKFEHNWIIHQIHTTANFSTRSKFISWFSGGLNYQIEHHIFPRISHIHYPAISKLLKETCEQYNVSYNEFPTLFSAIRSHTKYLKNLGVA